MELEGVSGGFDDLGNGGCEVSGALMMKMERKVAAVKGEAGCVILV